MDLTEVDVSPVDPSLLARWAMAPHSPLHRAVTALEEVRLWNSGLTTAQAAAMCASLVGGSHNLRRLMLTRTNLSTVEPGLLARALSQLEAVWLGRCQLTTGQLTALCKMLSSNCQLKRLDLSANDLSAVPPALLARAVTGLEEVGLREAHVTTHQWEELFTVLAEPRGSSPPQLGIKPQHALKGFMPKHELHLKAPIICLRTGFNNLAGVNPAIMARGVNRLRRADLTNSLLTGKQVIKPVLSHKSNI